MGNIFNKIRLGSALRSIKDACSWFHNSAIDVEKEKNLLIRIYYDSDLGSPIEKEVEKAFAASTYDNLKKFFPKWEPAQNLCKSIGSWIAHKKAQGLDLSKVVHHISTDRISADQGYHEIAKRTTAGLFSIGKIASRVTHLIGKGAHKFADMVLGEGVSDFVRTTVTIVAGETLRRVRNKIFSEESKKKVTKFVETGLKVAHTATKKIINFVDSATDKAQNVVEKTVSFISDIAKKCGEQLKPFKDKVVDTAKTIGNAVKEGAKVIFKKLKFW